MIPVAITVAIGSLILGLSEWARPRRKIGNELSRKIVHMVHAGAVAFWPFFVSYKFVIGVELVFLAAVLLARYFKLFSWLRLVGRKSWGEFFFPLGIIATALLAPPPVVFCFAILHLALADSLAALAGQKFGKKNSYKIFAQTKSISGSLVFWLVSLVLVSVFITLKPENGLMAITWPYVLFVPIAATMLEAFAPAGTDNLTVPIFVAVALNALFVSW